MQAAFVAFAVYRHIEQRKLHLPYQEHAALEVFGRQHFGEQAFRQRFARFLMRRHAAQHIEFPHEIFHELAGQLHRVPFHAVDAAHAQFVHAREQVVQAVSHFVEQRDDFVVRQARFFTGHGRREIAHQIGRRRLHLSCLVA